MEISKEEQNLLTLLKQKKTTYKKIKGQADLVHEARKSKTNYTMIINGIEMNVSEFLTTNQKDVFLEDLHNYLYKNLSTIETEIYEMSKAFVKDKK